MKFYDNPSQHTFQPHRRLQLKSLYVVLYRIEFGAYPPYLRISSLKNKNLIEKTKKNLLFDSGWFVCIFSLWAGTSRPIIWNTNLRSLCVSAGWMYNLSVYIFFLMDNWLWTWYFIFYVKKFGGFFNICCSFMLCNTHVTCYLYRSLCMTYL